MWRQQVSAKDTNRRDVETLRSDGHLEHSCCLNTIFVLRSELDKLLGSRQARDSGICQVHCQDVKVHVFDLLSVPVQLAGLVAAAIVEGVKKATEAAD